MTRALIFALLCWTVSAMPVAVTDGDTFKARVAVFLNLEAEERVRILGVDTPERGKPLAAEATAFTALWLGSSPVTLTTCGRDSFGRVLATVKRGQEDLGEALVGAGLAVRR